MKKYIFIGFGGFFGAILRYFIKNIHIYHYKEAVPINTLMINVAGSFLIGLLLTLAFEVWEMDENIRLGTTTGFLGAFTTFSTLCKETVELFKVGDYYSAISYTTVSTLLGLGAVYFGTILAREAIARVLRKQSGVDVDERI